VNHYQFQGLALSTATPAAIPASAARLANRVAANAALPTDSLSGVNVSFTVPFSLSGRIDGFAFRVQGTASVTGSLDTNGKLSGTFSAHGSGSATGSGWTVSFAGDASGTVSGPLSGVAINAHWSGSGSATDPAGNTYSGSLSGGWTGVVPLSAGTITQKVTVTKGDGAFSHATGSVSGSSRLGQFTTTTNPFPKPPPPPPAKYAQYLNYALMADATYTDRCAVSYLTQDGWTMNPDAKGKSSGIPFRDNPITGFHADIFKNANGDVVLAFRGTRNVDPRDWIFGNIAHGAGLPSTYLQALAAAQAARKIYGDKLTIVGHSLGGGEAQFAGLATSTPTVAFNGAGLSITDELWLMAKGLWTSKNLALITHIDNHNDPLTCWLQSVGGEVGTVDNIDSGDWGLAAHSISASINVLSGGQVSC
jgi:hypothetical protein